MSRIEITLGELYDVHNGLSKGSKYFGSGFPFLSFSCVFNNFFIPETLESFVQSTPEEQNSFSIRRGDVFITRTSETMDELGMSCVALRDIPTATYNGFTKRLRPKTDLVLPEYIGYYLRSQAFRAPFLGLAGSMTTRASLRNEALLNIQISLPTFAEQKKIASILKAYDDLIENNRHQIKLLEEAARRLYREWFVDFRFPGHEQVQIVDGVPEGWERRKLIDIADIQYGFAFDGSLFNNEKKGMPILRIRNIPQGITEDYTTEEAPEQYIVHNGDIVVGMDGEFHINSWCGGDAYLVQRTCRIKPKDENMKGWLIQAIFEPIKYFEKTVVGSTVAHLGKKHLDSIQLITSKKE